MAQEAEDGPEAVKRPLAQATQLNVTLREQLSDAKREAEQATARLSELKATLKATKLEELELEVGRALLMSLRCGCGCGCGCPRAVRLTALPLPQVTAYYNEILRLRQLLEQGSKGRAAIGVPSVDGGATESTKLHAANERNRLLTRENQVRGPQPSGVGAPVFAFHGSPSLGALQDLRIELEAAVHAAEEAKKELEPAADGERWGLPCPGQRIQRAPPHNAPCPAAPTMPAGDEFDKLSRSDLAAKARKLQQAYKVGRPRCDANPRRSTRVACACAWRPAPTRAHAVRPCRPPTLSPLFLLNATLCQDEHEELGELKEKSKAQAKSLRQAKDKAEKLEAGTACCWF